MKRILTTIIALTAVMTLWAQADSTKVKKKKERTIELSGEVYDSFTKAKVKALMTLMRKIVRAILRSFRKKGYNLKHILLVGYSRATEEYINRMPRL